MNQFGNWGERNFNDFQIFQDLQNEKRDQLTQLKNGNQIEEDSLCSLSQDLNFKLQKELIIHDNKAQGNLLKGIDNKTVQFQLPYLCMFIVLLSVTHSLRKLK